MGLPESIKQIRQKLFLNQKEFADALEVGLTTVSRWEGGKSIPNLIAIKKIKQYCAQNNIPFEIVETEWLTARLKTIQQTPFRR